MKLEIIFAVLFINSSALALYFWLKLRDERKAWAHKWATRQVGTVHSVEEDEQGIKITGQIIDVETLGFLKDQHGSFSIGPVIPGTVPIRLDKDKR